MLERALEAVVWNNFDGSINYLFPAAAISVYLNKLSSSTTSCWTSAAAEDTAKETPTYTHEGPS